MNEREIKALISLLDDSDYEVITHVQNKIISMGDNVIPYLELEWEKTLDPVLQDKIEDMIHLLQINIVKNNLQQWKENEQEDLLKGVYLIATYLYPDLSLNDIREEIEQIYYQVWVNFKQDLHPFDQVRALNQVLFQELRFKANTKNLSSPKNNLINIVLESKKGNPILLSVIYILVAQKLNLPIYGVNLPNVFIATYYSSEIQFYINVYNKGLIFSRSDIDHFINNLKLEPQSSFFEPCSNTTIVRRILKNLIMSFEKIGEHQKVEELNELLDLLEEG